MNNYSLTIDSITKTFGRRLIFKNVILKCEENGIWGIAGPNGSGKSTFVKCLCGIISPTRGKVIHSLNNKEIEPEKLHNHIGFVSPYLVLYDEFSAEENLHYFAEIRGVKYNKEKIDYLLNEFLLYDRRSDFVKAYSSGMKQRLKFIFALMHSPELVILDEPISNLDNSGKEKVYKIVNEEAKNSVIIIASNDDSDLALCSSILDLNNYKND
ncbi:MAG: ABC transporter ATP-binding protein [Ignavibacteria bacterium]|nr:ABC transporter ATP-binding protein [Ignavibacteria bacterium]MDP3831666.1 ABC transporter ATP-binding protein [Ignavibacteriaceae bacterium]